MSHSESHDYFRRRERAERAAAKNAATDAARRIHQQLAQGYAALLRNLDTSANQPTTSR